MAVRALGEAPTAQGFDPDAELVEAARLDPREFLTLYDRYVDRVLGYVKLRVTDRDVCEDVTSQVFTRALERIDQFNGRGTFAGWLFQIARNAISDVHRERPTDELGDAVSTLSDLQAGPEEQVLDRERATRLRALVKSLPPDEQHLLALRYGAGLDYEEICALVGGNPGAIRVRMHRLLERLRRRYPDDEA
jgi:RNA polymerase sigma-70 factor (ECF subfamily)